MGHAHRAGYVSAAAGTCARGNRYDKPQDVTARGSALVYVEPPPAAAAQLNRAAPPGHGAADDEDAAARHSVFSGRALIPSPVVPWQTRLLLTVAS